MYVQTLMYTHSGVGFTLRPSVLTQGSLFDWNGSTEDQELCSVREICRFSRGVIRRLLYSRMWHRAIWYAKINVWEVSCHNVDLFINRRSATILSRIDKKPLRPLDISFNESLYVCVCVCVCVCVRARARVLPWRTNSLRTSFCVEASEIIL
jgi:hypothetical protein